MRETSAVTALRQRLEYFTSRTLNRNYVEAVVSLCWSFEPTFYHELKRLMANRNMMRAFQHMHQYVAGSLRRDRRNYTNGMGQQAGLGIYPVLSAMRCYGCWKYRSEAGVQAS